MSNILVTRGNIQTLLTDTLRLAFGNWNTWPDALWRKVYSQYESQHANEYEMEMQGAAAAQIQYEGAPGTSTGFNQLYQTTYTHQYYSQKIKITRAAILDNRQQNNLPSYAMQLRKSLDTTRNQNAMLVFNNAFGVGSTGADSKPLCSTAHPISTGYLANTFTNGVQLNESALEDAVTIMRTYKSAAGIPIMTNPMKLLVPPQREFDAKRILDGPDRTGTANREINVLHHGNYFPEGIVVNPYILNPNYWFIVTDEEQGFKMFLREKVFFDDQGDIDSMNYTIMAIERYSMGYTNWRACFGSTGA